MGQDQEPDAGQKRTWDTVAERERKRAYRERKRLERERAGQALLEVLVERSLDGARNEHVGGVHSPTEDEYVARELAITRAHMDLPGPNRLPETIDSRDGSTRMERSERYLRWRHRAFLNGELDSL